MKLNSEIRTKYFKQTFPSCKMRMEYKTTPLHFERGRNFYYFFTPQIFTFYDINMYAQGDPFHLDNIVSY